MMRRTVAGMAVALLYLVAVPAAAQNPMEEADAHFQAGEWSEAASVYQGVLSADSTVSLAWYRLGRVYHEQGEFQAALDALAAAERHGFGPLFIAFARARSYTALGREDEAVAQLQGVAEAGFGGVGAITQDPGLEPLMDHPEMEAVLAQVERNSEPCVHNETARQFDFWVGTWDVYNPQGRQVGVNVIEPMLKGCVLQENWTGAGGSSGKSMNYYDPQRETWRQVWVSDQGNVLDYRQGEYRDGAMRFQGITIDAQGDTTLQKLTFHNVAPDTVRQVFEASTDGGETWNTTWLGVYVKRASESSDGGSEGEPGGS